MAPTGAASAVAAVTALTCSSPWTDALAAGSAAATKPSRAEEASNAPAGNHQAPQGECGMTQSKDSRLGEPPLTIGADASTAAGASAQQKEVVSLSGAASSKSGPAGSAAACVPALTLLQLGAAAAAASAGTSAGGSGLVPPVSCSLRWEGGALLADSSKTAISEGLVAKGATPVPPLAAVVPSAPPMRLVDQQQAHMGHVEIDKPVIDPEVRRKKVLRQISL